MHKSSAAVLLALAMGLGGCTSQSNVANKVMKSSHVESKNKEWSKGFLIMPLKINRSAPNYEVAKKKALLLLKGEADRDRQSRVATVASGTNRAAHCKQVANSVGKRYKTPSEYAESYQICMQAQYNHDIASLKSAFGKSLKVKKDSAAEYAHFRWNLITLCGTSQKQTTRDIYYGYIEPKDKPSEAHFFLSYRTQNECEAVYERLRRKTDRVLRKTKRILDKYGVGYSVTNDTF